MTINLLNDLIIDEYGNYYIAIEKKTPLEPNKGELTLVNAFMEYSFRQLWGEDLLGFDYHGEYDGERAMTLLKEHIKRLEDEMPNCIRNIKDVKEHYELKFIPLYHKNPKIEG